SAEKIDAESVNALPETLDGAYREFLDRLASSDAITPASEYSQVLGILSVAPEQITETQMAGFISAEITHIRHLIKSLRPFLDVDDSLPASKRGYTIYHRSFADFLLDRDRAETYWCDPKKYHALIARSYMDADGSKLQINDQLDNYGCRNLPVHLLGAQQ